MTGLLDRLAKTHPESVAALLEQLLADTAKRAKSERAAVRFELLRAATQIGPSGHRVVAEVARLHSDLMWVRSLSVYAAQKADPTAPVVLHVADAVLNHFRRYTDGDGYRATEVLDHLRGRSHRRQRRRPGTDAGWQDTAAQPGRRWALHDAGHRGTDRRTGRTPSAASTSSP